MSSRRLAAALGPLIALVLIGGVIAAVVGGSDDAGTDFAREPGAQSPAPDGTAEPGPSPDAEPTDGTEPDATADPEATGRPDAESDPDSDDDEPIAGEGAFPPGAGPTPMPEPSASPTSGGSLPQVQDPTALTGGWEGGTPNTGTAVSAAGLLLLILGGGLLWLRRART